MITVKVKNGKLRYLNIPTGYKIKESDLSKFDKLKTKDKADWLERLSKMNKLETEPKKK